MKISLLFLLFPLLASLNGTSTAATILSSNFNNINTTGTAATGITWVTSGIEAPATSLTFYDTSNPSTVFSFRNPSATATNIGPARNIEIDGSWSTSFTLVPTTTLDLTSFGVDFRAISNGGADQTAAKTAVFTLTVSQGSTLLGTFSQTVTDSVAVSTADTARVNLDLSPLENLAIGTTYTFVLTAARNTATSGNNAAIDNLALTGTLIPEPSSALLGLVGSLLFLVRRRA